MFPRLPEQVTYATIQHGGAMAELGAGKGENPVG